MFIVSLVDDLDYVSKMNEKRQSKLLECLKVLGNTPNVIAKSLEGMKIKGVSGDNNTCPLAMYLKRARYKDVSVDSSVVYCKTRSGVEVSVDLPKGCYEFVSNFDENEYPKLVKATKAE